MARKRTEVRWWQRLVQRFASTEVGITVFSHVLHHIDRLLLTLSGGRVSVPGALAGLPTVRLTTVGAKTGTERTVPVVALRDGEKCVLVASNWGRERHPAWYHNLSENPVVKLTREDTTERYIARDATEEERAEYWEWATDTYPGFEAYDRRSGDREIPVVVLKPPEEE